MTTLTRQDHENIVLNLNQHPNASRVENMTTSHRELRNQLEKLKDLSSKEKNWEEFKNFWEEHKKLALEHSKIEDKVIFVDLYHYYSDRIPNEGKGMKFIDAQHEKLEKITKKVDEIVKKSDYNSIKDAIKEYCDLQIHHMQEEEILLIPIFLNFSFYEYTCYAASIGYKFATGAHK